MKKILGLVGILGVVLGARAESADLYVPENYTTIQEAVNAGTSGDTIYVGSGTYNEAVYINKGVHLVGPECYAH